MLSVLELESTYQDVEILLTGSMLYVMVFLYYLGRSIYIYYSSCKKLSL